MLLLPPSEEVEERMRRQLPQDPQAKAKALVHLKEWLGKQPHLPHIEDVFLERFLYGCKYRLSKCKEVLDMYYTVRGAVPEFFKNRDPTGDDIHRDCESSLIATLPRLSPDGHRIYLQRCITTDVSKIDGRSNIKRGFMIMDSCIHMENVLGCIIIVDMKYSAASHMSKYPPVLLRKLVLCMQDAYPVRIKQIHFVNCPAFVSKVVDIIKSFLKEKIRNRIQVHSKGLETLYKFVPQSLLPKEYGGQEASFKEISDAWQRRLESYRDWFRAEELKIVDESKRPGNSLNYGELFGADGFFKKMDID